MIWWLLWWKKFSNTNMWVIILFECRVYDFWILNKTVILWKLIINARKSNKKKLKLFHPHKNAIFNFEISIYLSRRKGTKKSYVYMRKSIRRNNVLITYVRSSVSMNCGPWVFCSLTFFSSLNNKNV